MKLTKKKTEFLIAKTYDEGLFGNNAAIITLDDDMIKSLTDARETALLMKGSATLNYLSFANVHSDFLKIDTAVEPIFEDWLDSIKENETDHIFLEEDCKDEVSSFIDKYDNSSPYSCELQIMGGGNWFRISMPFDGDYDSRFEQQTRCIPIGEVIDLKTESEMTL